MKLSDLIEKRLNRRAMEFTGMFSSREQGELYIPGLVEINLQGDIKYKHNLYINDKRILGVQHAS